MLPVAEAGPPHQGADPGHAGDGAVHDLHASGAPGPSQGKRCAELQRFAGPAEKQPDPQEMGEQDSLMGTGKGSRCGGCTVPQNWEGHGVGGSRVGDGVPLRRPSATSRDISGCRDRERGGD